MGLSGAPWTTRLLSEFFLFFWGAWGLGLKAVLCPIPPLLGWNDIFCSEGVQSNSSEIPRCFLYLPYLLTKPRTVLFVFSSSFDSPCLRMSIIRVCFSFSPFVCLFFEFLFSFSCSLAFCYVSFHFPGTWQVPISPGTERYIFLGYMKKWFPFKHSSTMDGAVALVLNVPA